MSSESDVETGSSTPITAAEKKAAHRAATFLGRGTPVTFRGLSYSVVNAQNKKEKIKLLTDVSGYLQPGEMSALMGPSGSGKTTLLDILAGRKTVGAIEGDVRFGGEAPTYNYLRRYTGYVEQFDTLVDILTVEEMLMYTAELSRPEAEPLAEKRAAVERLIDVLGLEGARAVRIGNPLARGISGGQAKRVNIGCSLVTNPRVLFLDEPTSGLDSYTSNEVMTVVKQLASGGITVVATVHSPTPYIFGLFDRLLLLLRGQLGYFGPNGPPALDFFHGACPKLQGVRPGQSEAEWLTDLTVQADRQGRAAEFAAAYAASGVCADAAAEMAAVEAAARSGALGAASRKALATRRATETGFASALRTLLKYRTARDYASGEYLGPRISDKLIFSLLIFTLYLNVGRRDLEDNVLNISSLLFMWSLLPAYGAASYVPTIVLERALYTRERNDGLYRPATYLAFKMLGELGVALANSIAFSAIVYFAVGLQGSFALFWFVYFITLALGVGMAYLVAALSPSMEVANAALPAYVTTLLFFCGMLIRWDDIPDYWKWYGWLNPLRYAYAAQMKNEFAGDRDVVFVDGQTVLEYYSLDGGPTAWAWAGLESAWLVVFFGGTLLALTYVKHVKR